MNLLEKLRLTKEMKKQYLLQKTEKNILEKLKQVKEMKRIYKLLNSKPIPDTSYSFDALDDIVRTIEKDKNELTIQEMKSHDNEIESLGKDISKVEDSEEYQKFKSLTDNDKMIEETPYSRYHGWKFWVNTNRGVPDRDALIKFLKLNSNSVVSWESNITRAERMDLNYANLIKDDINVLDYEYDKAKTNAIELIHKAIPSKLDIVSLYDEVLADIPFNKKTWIAYPSLTIKRPKVSLKAKGTIEQIETLFRKYFKVPTDYDLKSSIQKPRKSKGSSTIWIELDVATTIIKNTRELN